MVQYLGRPFWFWSLTSARDYSGRRLFFSGPCVWVEMVSTGCDLSAKEYDNTSVQRQSGFDLSAKEYDNTYVQRQSNQNRKSKETDDKDLQQNKVVEDLYILHVDEDEDC